MGAAMIAAVTGGGIVAAEECPTAGEAGPIDLDEVRLSALPFESCELLIVRILTRTRTHTRAQTQTISSQPPCRYFCLHIARDEWRREEEEVAGEHMHPAVQERYV